MIWALLTERVLLLQSHSDIQYILYINAHIEHSQTCICLLLVQVNKKAHNLQQLFPPQLIAMGTESTLSSLAVKPSSVLVKRCKSPNGKSSETLFCYSLFTVTKLSPYFLLPIAGLTFFYYYHKDPKCSKLNF